MVLMLQRGWPRWGLRGLGKCIWSALLATGVFGAIHTLSPFKMICGIFFQKLFQRVTLMLRSSNVIRDLKTLALILREISPRCTGW